MSIEAMKQALEALKSCSATPHWPALQPTITSLRQAIAEAEKQEQGEPVAWIDLLKEAEQIVKDKFLYKRFIDGTPLANDIPCWMAEFAQQYAHLQPQRTWVGLSDEEMNDIWSDQKRSGESITRAIEAKLKERNHD